MLDADRYLSRLAHLAAIRQEIAAGGYETPDKLSDAVEGLLGELTSAANALDLDTQGPPPSPSERP